jgi:gas vesicle protein
MAFLGGALGGVAIALLTAPQSGKETRQTVRGWASEARTRAGQLPSTLREVGTRAGHAAREAYAEARHHTSIGAREGDNAAERAMDRAMERGDAVS